MTNTAERRMEMPPELVQSFKGRLAREGITLQAGDETDIDRVLQEQLDIVCTEAVYGGPAASGKEDEQPRPARKPGPYMVLRGGGIPSSSSGHLASGNLASAEPEDVLAAIDLPHMLSADDFAERLRITRETLNQWRKAGRVIGVSGAKRGNRYPLWQLDSRGRPYEGIKDILEALDGDHWAAWRFLEETVPEIGEVGFQALARGRLTELLSVLEARAYGSFS